MVTPQRRHNTTTTTPRHAHVATPPPLRGRDAAATRTTMDDEHNADERGDDETTTPHPNGHIRCHVAVGNVATRRRTMNQSSFVVFAYYMGKHSFSPPPSLF
jgi:hypothetical protein